MSVSNPTSDDPRLHALAKELSTLHPFQQQALLARAKWLLVRAPHQVPPTTTHPDWLTWALLAGRGAGKTRSSAEWVWWECWEHPRTRALVAAPTFSDLQQTCFEGDSGLLSIIPPSLIRKYKVSTLEIELQNGSLIRGIPASEPERFRGPQFHIAWADELAAWGPTLETMDMAWNMMQFGLRLGKNPRLVISTTPKPVPLIRDLDKRAKTPSTSHVYITRASSYANLHNLAPQFRETLLQHEGTLLGRQEIHAEILDPEEQGIIKRSWFKLYPVSTPLPHFHYVLQSYDCATSDKTVNDPSAGLTLGIFSPSQDEPWAVMLLDAWTDYLKYPTLRTRIQEEFKTQWGEPNQHGITKRPDLILVEDKSAGISLIQELQLAGLPTRAYNPGRADKTQRLNLVAPLILNGLFWIPESNLYPGQPLSFANPVIDQACAFPDVRNDDLVDCLSQGLRYLKDSGYLRLPKLHHEAQFLPYADDFVERRIKNPYGV